MKTYLVLDFIALDASSTRAYGRWCASQAEDDWIRFMDYATQRQRFLEHLPPFSGVLEPRICAIKQRLAVIKWCLVSP